MEGPIGIARKAYIYIHYDNVYIYIHIFYKDHTQDKDIHTHMYMIGPIGITRKAHIYIHNVNMYIYTTGPIYMYRYVYIYIYIYTYVPSYHIAAQDTRVGIHIKNLYTGENAERGLCVPNNDTRTS